MGKVKQAIEKAIENIKSATHNTYGARIYDNNQVILILNDLLEVASEDAEDTGGLPVDKAMIGELVDSISDLIVNNIDDMSDNDIVDETSLELSLSGGRYNIDNLDCDKEAIASEASYNLEGTITEWAVSNGLLAE
jgi:hypothetical protein